MRIANPLSPAAWLLAILLVVALVAGCDSAKLPDWLRRELRAPRETGELVVLTLRGPTTMQQNPGGYKPRDDEEGSGYEHDLAALFARELGVRIKFKVLVNHAQLLAAMDEGRGHLAAAQLAQTDALRQRFAFGPNYKSMQYQLIYRKSDAKPRNLAELGSRKVAVVAGTPAHDILINLQSTHAGLTIEPISEQAEETLLAKVESKAVDFALFDALGFSVNRRLHPDLAAAFNVGPELKVAWAFTKAADEDLKQSARLFFDKMRANGTLARLQDRYFGHTGRLQPVDSEAFLERIQTVLPKLRPYFHEAEEITGIEWRLLAAIGYQESHWDPNATSPTGVRGLMMLTEDTADRMKVKNRLDPRDSIIGGAKYLALLRDTVPLRIAEPDRTWLALAAYNQGYGHLEDARILTQKRGLNADAWLDVRKVYPLLREPQHYESLKHGFCRGDEAVHFVESVRNYYDIISRLEPAYVPELRFMSPEEAAKKPKLRTLTN
ncbi:MAG: membrane-bound lytic murein transglycosylase MltF [Betaproteobacteria bacterium]|nr:membrane-bound lytic murein transglycosylase MltF [Betaproteobacteria bacterium]